MSSNFLTGIDEHHINNIKIEFNIIYFLDLGNF